MITNQGTCTQQWRSRPRLLLKKETNSETEDRTGRKGSYEEILVAPDRENEERRIRIKAKFIVFELQIQAFLDTVEIDG